MASLRAEPPEITRQSPLDDDKMVVMTERDVLDKLEYHRNEYMRLLNQAASMGIETPSMPLLADHQLYRLVNELDEANKKLSEQVLTDSLTGIGNRRLFDNKLGELLADAGRGRPLSVMMFDIDNFKSFNDMYGHQVGDDVICQVATTMSSQIRRVDCLARYGGEEFSLATATERDGAEFLAEKLRQSVSEIQTVYRPITVSVGVAQFKSTDDAKTILARADAALYMAKRSGKNRVMFVND